MVVGEMEIRLRADIARLQRDMDSGRRVVGDATERMGRAADAVKMAFAGMLAGMGASQIIQMSDSYAKFTAQLRLASTSTREYAAAYADVKQIANAAQQDLSATGMLYARIANGTRELGTTQKQVAAITETVNLALKVSGAAASESASAQLQLSQAFASGTLRGEEFNAVNEAAPRLMKALADGMGRPVGELKKMAEEGKITSKIMAEVLPDALLKLRQEATEVQTVAGAFTVLKNNMMEFAGVQANASGAVSVLTGAIGMLANNLTLLAGAAATLTAAKLVTWFASMTSGAIGAIAASRALATATLASAVASTQAAATAAAAKLVEAQSNVAATASASALAAARLAEVRASVLSASGAVQLAIVQNALIPAQARAAAMAEANAIALSAQAVAGNLATTTAVASTAAITAQATATTLLSRAMGMLRGAVAFLGGPLSAIIILLGAAATAWAVWGGKAKEASKEAAESFEEAQARIVKGLDEQISKNEKLLKLKNLGLTTKDAEKNLANIDQLAAASKRLNDINNRAGEFASGKSNTDIEFARIRVLKDITDLVEKKNKAEQTGAAVAKQSTDERVAALKIEYSNKSEKMAAEIKAIEDLKGKTSEYGLLVQRIRDKYAEKSPAEAGMNKKATAYQNLITSIKEKIAAGELEMSGNDKLTDAQKMTIKLDAEIASGKSKLSDESIKSARAQIAIVAAQDETILAAENVKKATQQLNDERGTAYASAMAEAVANELLVETYNKTKGQIEQLELARLEDRLSQRESLELDREEVAQLERMIDAKRRNAAAVGKLDLLDTGSASSKAKDLLDILTQVDAATKSAASSMTASFGSVGTAIGGLTTALSGYAVQQQAIAAQLAAAKDDKKNDPAKIAKLEVAAANASAQAKIKSYGDMSGAAKGFFKENSKGYLALEGAEKAFRAMEMAMAVEAMVKKIFFKEGEVSANLALNTTKLTGEATTTAASVGLAGTEASAWGITAVVKAIASLPFPANLAAGAATLAAVVAIGAKMMGGIGGSGSNIAKDRQAAAGTGSILGDSSAKSASIAKSIELAAANSNIELTHTAGMLRALLSIESNIGNLGSVLTRSGAVTGDVPADVAGSAARLDSKIINSFPITAIFNKLLGGKLAEWSGKITNAIFGGKVSTQDTGISIQKGALSGILANGANASRYIDTKKDGGAFHSDKYRTDFTSLGAEASDQFTKVIAGMAKGVTEAGKLLGLGGDAFTARLNSFVVDLGKISTKDLKPEEVQKQLEAVFSKVADDMARWSVDGLAQFIKVGEGPFETLARVASNYANLNSVLESVGMKFGAVGISSIAAREHMIELAGGIDELAGQTASFASNFLTEAERLAPVASYVATEMSALGLASVKTRDQFKAVVLGLDLTSTAGQNQYVALMALESAFAKVHAATVDLTKSEQAIADERADLQSQLDDLIMTQAQLLAKQRKALDPSNRALFDQIEALKAMRTAQDAAKTSMGDVISRMKSFGDSARTLRDSLLMGALSVLTPEQQYAEARRQRDATRAAALGGDTAAQGNLSAMQTAFLTISQKVNGGDAQYSADFASVLQMSDEIAKWSAGQVDVAQSSLDALNAQVLGIADLNATAHLIADQLAGTPNYSAMGTENMAPLVAEIKTLREEIKGLRADQAAQTGDIIVSNGAVTMDAAREVSSGVAAAATDSGWESRNAGWVNLR